MVVLAAQRWSTAVLDKINPIEILHRANALRCSLDFNNAAVFCPAQFAYVTLMAFFALSPVAMSTHMLALIFLLLILKHWQNIIGL